MMTALEDPAVRAYLADLRHALADRSPEERELVIDGVRQHIADATADGAGPADVQRVLDGLGDPAAIAAESAPEDGDAGPRGQEPGAPFLERRGGAWLTVLTLVFGGFVVPVLGWVVGVVLLWSSRGWNRTEQLIGTLAAPVGILLAAGVVLLLGLLADGGSTGTLTGAHLLVLGAFVLAPLLQVAAAVYLLLRFRPRG